jgi:RimJ/RimL family protein N-acetyltransferase
MQTIKMKLILETERLLLRQFTTDDAKFIVELVNTPGWIEFIGDRNIKTDKQAKIYLENGPLKSYELNGFGLYLVELKREAIPIGMCGIIKRDHLENPDIGFAFLPEFTGKGLAFEIAKATMIYASERLRLPKIFAVTDSHNIKSIKLLEKIGLSFIHKLRFPGEEEELMLFSN